MSRKRKNPNPSAAFIPPEDSDFWQEMGIELDGQDLVNADREDKARLERLNEEQDELERLETERLRKKLRKK